MWHAADEFIGIGYFRGREDLFVGCAGAPVGNVFPYRPAEQNRLL
jgi:hypothetical protein